MAATPRPRTCYKLPVTGPENRPVAALAGGQRFRLNRRRAILPLAGAGLGMAMFAVVALALGPVAGPSGAPSAQSSNSTAIVGAASTGASTTSAGATLPSIQTAPPDPTPLPVSQLTGYIWPLANAGITLPFGPTSWGEFVVNGQLFHDGVDMATWCGDRIVAAHDGVVLAAGRHFDDYMGWQGPLSEYYNRLNAKKLWDWLPIVVVIDDGNGYRSLYAHMSVLTVKVGQHMKAGQLLGYEGATGHATGCHLHFGLFSPIEKADFGLDAGVAHRMLLPASETARINPLLVLPFRCDVEEMAPLRPVEAAACPAPTPKPVPTATPTTKPSPTLKPTSKPSASPKK